MKLSEDYKQMFCDAADANDFEVREDYSGRGMYGKTCVGVVGDMKKICSFVSEVSLDIKDYNDANEVGSSIMFVPDIFANTKIDSMGLDNIIYWEKLSFEEE